MQGHKTNNVNQALNYAQLQKLLCVNKFVFLSDCWRFGWCVSQGWFFLVILKTQKFNVKLYTGKYGFFFKNVFWLRNSLNTALL